MTMLAPPRRSVPWLRAGLAAATGLAVGFAFISSEAAVSEAWFFAFLGLVGLGSGAMGLLMIGHLLGGAWLDPVRAELEAAALTLPVVAILGAPLAFRLADLYPWAATGFVQAGIPAMRLALLEPTSFLLRSAFYLVLWCGLALLLARPGAHRMISALGLALLAPTATLAAIDWVMSREPHWWASLFGFAFAATQLTPALAGAILVRALHRQEPEAQRLRSLEQVLMTLALLTAWLWFIQFLLVWMGDLPDETWWYLSRYDNLGDLMTFVAAPAMGLGIVLLAFPRVGGPLLAAACALLILQHLAHMIWIIHPPLGAGGATAILVFVTFGLSALWMLWAGAILRARRG